MNIEMNKNIEEYKEGIVLGLSAREFIHAVAAVLSVTVVVLLLNKKLGLIVSAYLAMPVAIPIALNGFSDKNGLSYLEIQRRRLRNKYGKKVLLYSSTNNQRLLKSIKIEEEKNSKAGDTNEAQELMKKVKYMGIIAAICFICLIIFIMIK